MLDERARRRQEDRRAFAYAVAYAFNEPQKIDELVPAPEQRKKPTADTGFQKGKWWP